MTRRTVVCENGWVGLCGLPVGEQMITPFGLSRIASHVERVVGSEHDDGMDPLFPMEGN